MSPLYRLTVAACWISYCLCLDIASLPSCHLAEDDNPGYSSIEEDGRVVWTHCNFPNPRLAPAQCGRSTPSALCDPTGIINTTSGVSVAAMLDVVARTTPYQCTPWHGHRQNISVTVVLLPHLRVPDLSNTNRTCLNSCGEVRPTLPPVGRSPTPAEMGLAADTLRAGLLDSYGPDFCNSLVLLLYWANQGTLSASVGRALSDQMPAALLAQVVDEAQAVVDAGDLPGGVQLFAVRCAGLLTGTPPALYLLAACCTALSMAAVCLGVTYSGRPTYSGYFDEGVLHDGLQLVVRVALGIWFIEYLLVAIIWMQDKVRLWTLCLPLGGAIVCAAAAGYLIQQSDT